jgi:hypothetical protein
MHIQTFMASIGTRATSKGKMFQLLLSLRSVKIIQQKVTIWFKIQQKPKILTIYIKENF